MAARKAKKKPVKRTPKKQTRTPRSTEGKKEVLSSVDPAKKKRVLALMNKVNTHAKKELLKFASDSPSTYYVRRPSGITQLDVDTGGGLPAGGLCTLGGPDGAGKSTLMYLYFAMNQKLHGPNSAIAYAYKEGAIDFLWARKCGWMVAVPDEDIELMQKARRRRGADLLTPAEVAGLKTEIGINVAIPCGLTAEDTFDGMLYAIDSLEFQIVGLDSVEATMPNQEAKQESLEKQGQQAARATVISRFMQHFHGAMSGGNFTTTIATMQVRSNRAKAEASSFIAKRMSDHTTSPAWALRHGALINVNLEKGQSIKSGAKGKEKKIGRAMKWEIQKGKVGTHDGIKGETEFNYVGLFDLQRTLLLAALKYGVAEENDGAILVKKLNGDELFTFEEGADQFCDDLYDNFEMEERVRLEVMAAAGKTCLYR
jgi:RecA/RadA recombinase